MGNNPDYRSFDDCQIIRCENPGNLDCDSEVCPQLTVYYKFGRILIGLAQEAYGEHDEREQIVRRFVLHHINVFLVGSCLRSKLDLETVEDLTGLPTMEEMKRIINSDYEPNTGTWVIPE